MTNTTTAVPSATVKSPSAPPKNLLYIIAGIPFLLLGYLGLGLAIADVILRHGNWVGALFAGTIVLQIVVLMKYSHMRVARVYAGKLIGNLYLRRLYRVALMFATLAVDALWGVSFSTLLLLAVAGLLSHGLWLVFMLTGRLDLTDPREQ